MKQKKNKTKKLCWCIYIYCLPIYMCTWLHVCIQYMPTHIRLHAKTYFRTCINLRKANALAGNSLKWALTNSEMIATIAIKLRRHFRDNAFDHDLAKALGIDSNLDFIRTPMKEQPNAAIASATIPSIVFCFFFGCGPQVTLQASL